MTSATKATPPLSRCHTWIDETQWAYFQLNSPTSHTVCIEMTVAGRQRGGSGGDGSGVEGMEGEGREGVTRDCLNIGAVYKIPQSFHTV